MGLNNLKGDELTIRGRRRGMETTVAKLKDNKHLRSLYLYFRRSHDDASSSKPEWKATIEGLQPHTNLKKLTLCYYGGASLYNFLSSLTNLVVLSLNDCSKCQQLPSLDKFHSIKEMDLCDLSSLEYITVDEGDSYFSTSSSPIISVLPSLQRLKLKRLPIVRGWWRSDMVENQVEQVVSPLFPRLSSLSIKHCPKLTSMPSYPNLVKKLKLVTTSGKHFEQTILMRVPQPQILARAAAEAEASPSSVASSSTTTSDYVASYPLSKLKYLTLKNIVDLQCLWADQMNSLLELGIEDCEEFEGIKWPETPALTSLGTLKLLQLPKLKYFLPPGRQHLISLDELTIDGCRELQVSNDDDSIGWQALTKICTLVFDGLPHLATLPEGLQFAALNLLEIWGCKNFTRLPDWIWKMSSLVRIIIRNCPNFKLVPTSTSSDTSLPFLEIDGEEMNPREIREALDLTSSTKEPRPVPRTNLKKFRLLQLCNK